MSDTSFLSCQARSAYTVTPIIDYFCFSYMHSCLLKGINLTFSENRNTMLRASSKTFPGSQDFFQGQIKIHSTEAVRRYIQLRLSRES